MGAALDPEGLMAATFRTLQRLPIDGAPSLLLQVSRTRFGGLAFFVVPADLTRPEVLAQAATREEALAAIDGAAARLVKILAREGAA